MPEVRQGLPGGAVRVARKTGKSIAQVAEDLGVPKGTLADWVAQGRPAPVRTPRPEECRHREAAPVREGER